MVFDVGKYAIFDIKYVSYAAIVKITARLGVLIKPMTAK
jgi:hypothetical protein